ncbi:hypothetical protein O6H91_13G068600 [Diphasiastrum complanatum]|uniref:Uncharacterized protein n=2 Tax=Diphasiastrum complanatum TaxID=34168 RepID=A0ACC2BWC5_DIPCM|nr:hypothetical protein O6H91_13G068600 [Diphasiastrum complanatum]KAJ7533874.1 hypothetical protein O6H91_13G068600 [Diphasiastrum complanatum]
MAEVALVVVPVIYGVGCLRWVWKRLFYRGVHDSESWPLDHVEDFKPVPRMCQLILAVYEVDLKHPKWAPPGGYTIQLENILYKVDYAQTDGIVPPYILYLDHENKDIVVALRGLNLGKARDYETLLDNKLGKQLFKGGYVHHGLLRAAVWLLVKEKDTLSRLVSEYPTYTLTFTGHSLGSGVASLATVLLANYNFLVANIARSRLQCFGIAPARCMSLNLAVEYADIIDSIILQDDFLARTATPLQDIFKSALCLPCLLCGRCLRDTCIPEKKLLEDPRRLYVPGRLHHIVDREFCRCGRYPPVVKTNIPVEGRFEHVVLSCDTTSDHSLIWIEREARTALEIMAEQEDALQIPESQKMARLQTQKKEHNEVHHAALERMQTLNIPNASTTSDNLGDEKEHTYKGNDGHESMSTFAESGESVQEDNNDEQRSKLEWEALVNQLFEKGENGRVK